MRWAVPGYRELKELGAGAQGRVVLAEHVDSGQLVAIKYLAEGMLGDERALELFRREAELLVRVANPHIAQLFAYVEDPGGAALVMEPVSGVSLRRVMDEQEGPVTPEAALVVLKGSLLGLGAAHQAGVIHRDYKPANVIVGGSGKSKLIDFGVAGLTGEAGRSGTPAYMSPEQWQGQPASPATDLYAAACVFFECITGHRPYAGGEGSLSTLRDQHLYARVPLEEVPEPVRALVLRGMKKMPGERLWDAGQFVLELETTAAAAYGADWEGRGWAALGAAAAGLPVAVLGSSVAATGVKGLLAKFGGAKVAAGVGGATAVAATAAFLLWPSPPPYEHIWNTDAVVPTNQLHPVDGGFITYARTKRGTYEVVKLNAKTGQIQWSHPASDFDPGNLPENRVDGNIFVLRQNVDRRFATEQIVAVDIPTGRVLWRHGQTGLNVWSEPERCGRGRFCVEVSAYSRPPSTATKRIRVLDARTGAMLSESRPLGVVRLGPGLTDSLDHSQIVRITSDGKELWRRPIREIFGYVNPLEVTVTRVRHYGRWRHNIFDSHNYLIDRKGGTYAGEIGLGGRRISSEKMRYFDNATTAAFDAATGRKLWSRPGTTVSCGDLVWDVDYPMRCRITGKVDESSEDPEDWRLINVDVTVEGFDLDTGNTRWSWRAGAVRDLAVGSDKDQDVIRIDRQTYLVQTSSGRYLLDAEKGARRLEGKPPIGWCWGETTDIRTQSQKDAAEPQFWMLPQRKYWPCDADGREVRLPEKIPEFAGARSGDVYAWQGGRGVQAIQVN